MKLFSSHGKVALLLPTEGEAGFCPKNAGEAEILQILARIGFVGPVDHGSAEPLWHWSSDHSAADRALLALLARFNLDLEIGMAPDDAAWIAAAIWEPSPGEAVGDVFSGTGFRPDDAVRSCLGEFAEFQSWLYRPSDDRRRCDRRAFGERAIDPWHALGFAQAQRDRRLDFNSGWRGYDSIPELDAFDGEIDWNPVEALANGATHWLPTRLCFGRYADRVSDGWRSDSNGCAAGRTQQHALAHALLELVERDATGVWWYGQIPRPDVAPALEKGDPLADALAKRTAMGQRVWLLDLTHDLEIPVIAAILADEDGNLLAVGFGCNMDPLRAARSAYLEMCQMELSVAFVRRRVMRAGDMTTPEDRRLLDWMSNANVGRLTHLRPGDGLIARRPPMASSDEGYVVELVLERLQRAKLETYVLDLQRPDIGVPAVRAFVPGLCHFKPRLGFRRLIEVPRALRWRDAGFDFKDLNERPLLL